MTLCLHPRRRARAAPRCSASFSAAMRSPADAADDDLRDQCATARVAARNDDAAGVARALHDGAAVNARNRLGESALLIALKKNRADLAQLVLDAGADVNEAAVNGVTPLMAAAYAGNVEMTRTLLARGADVAPADRIEEERDDIRGRRRPHGDRDACCSHKGVDPNAVYRNDLTALMWAAGYGQDRDGSALLDAGARVDPRGQSRQERARHGARVQARPQTVELLESAAPQPLKRRTRRRVRSAVLRAKRAAAGRTPAEAPSAPGGRRGRRAHVAARRRHAAAPAPAAPSSSRGERRSCSPSAPAFLLPHAGSVTPKNLTG